jgi:hypothetical protein
MDAGDHDKSMDVCNSMGNAETTLAGTLRNAPEGPRIGARRRAEVPTVEPNQVPSRALPESGQRHGIGQKTFATQLEQARELGDDRIELVSARNDDPNVRQIGYKVWPKFGFDADLSRKRMALAPAPLRSAKKLSDLLATEDDQEWWDKHGQSAPTTFDMAPGSQSWKTRRAYVQSRRAGR